jgi:carbon-monoxide dehydrogenase large subunit
MAAIAAGMLQVDTAVLELRDGAFHLGEATIPLKDIANVSYLHNFALPPGIDPGLVAFVCYEPAVAEPFPNPETGQFNVANTHTSAAAGAVVEVDIETGEVEIKNLTVVHDCGRVINQEILDGQIRGAVAQSIGATFFEELIYDDNGQPLTTTLLDYIVPGFNDVFEPKIVHVETPSELIGGFRGAGEGPIIVTPAALANAVADALSPLGAKILQTNLGPQRVKEILR